MDYEKKYKETLEIIKGNLDALNEITETGAEIVNIQSIKNCFYRAFPELKESEDEKIRKAIIESLSEYGYLPQTSIKVKDAIAWLKQQGEQKTNYCHHEVDLSGCSEEYRKAYYDGWNNCNLQWQHWLDDNHINVGERFDYQHANIKQKDFAPIPEPKFKVGDYIKHNKANIIRKVVSVNSGSYYVENIETNGGIELFNAEQNFHLWTIQDAKEGDVLVVPPVKGSEHSEQIFIFKEIKDREHVKNAVEYYCRCMDNKFAANECGFMGQSDDYLTPATKEQRDLLFQKMKEAGYEWDYNKKGLRKIEKQKPIEWNEENEEMLQALVSGIGCYTYFSGIQSEDIVNWLKSLKQRFKEELLCTG